MFNVFYSCADNPESQYNEFYYEISEAMLPDWLMAIVTLDDFVKIDVTIGLSHYRVSYDPDMHWIYK